MMFAIVKRLAASGDAKQRLFFFARFQAFDQLSNRRRLIARRLILRLKSEFRTHIETFFEYEKTFLTLLFFISRDKAYL
jgi:hypothetical protein